MGRALKDQLSESELMVAYELVDSIPMESRVLAKNVNDAKHDFPRGRKSLDLLAARIHLCKHGCVPKGLSEDPTWYKVSKNLLTFVESQGYDSFSIVNEARARVGMKAILKKPVKTISQEQASKLFIDYAKSNFNKEQQPHQWHTLVLFRANITKSIKSGDSVKLAVSKIVNH